MRPKRIIEEIEVAPSRVSRGAAAMRAASAAAEAESSTTVQGIATACMPRPDHWTTATAMALCSPARMAASTTGFRKASARPIFCSSNSPWSTL